MLTNVNDMTYGQRIALGKLIEKAEKLDEAAIFLEVLKIMGGDTYRVKYTAKEVEYAESTLNKVKYWVNAETKLLKSEPSSQEKRAGVLQMVEKLQELGVLNTLAEKYGKSPDEILKWPFGTVFGMLYASKVLHEYQKQLEKIKEMDNKRRK